MGDDRRKWPLVQGALASGDKRELARRFRREATPSERKAWELLRNRRCLGLKFRRQQVIRGFVVDFYCAELRLVLEIDGAVHDRLERQIYDTERATHLERAGIRHQLHLHPEQVTASNLRALLEPLVRPSSSPPLP